MPFERKHIGKALGHLTILIHHPSKEQIFHHLPLIRWRFDANQGPDPRPDVYGTPTDRGALRLRPGGVPGGQKAPRWRSAGERIRGRSLFE